MENTNSKKYVLIFTYYWPPAGGVAVQRWLRLTKYLLDFEWIPIIITVDNGAYSYLDDQLIKEINPNVIVYKTKTIEPFTFYNLLRGKKDKKIPLAMVDSSEKKSLIQKIAEFIRANFFIPDARVGWNFFAYKKGKEIIQKKNIEIIITTGPPHSTHLVGLKLRNKFGIKWIADFRDPWTTIFTNFYFKKTKLSKIIDKYLEDKVIKNADYITVIGPSMKAEFLDRNKKIEIIWNGYDEDSFNEILTEKNKRFTISYTGNLYKSQNPEALWKSLYILKTEKNIDFELKFFGKIDPIIEKSVKKFNLENHYYYSDFIPHKKAIEEMYKADVLLFVIPNTPFNNRIITGKLFEYLAVERPILAYGNKNGDAAKILEYCRRDEMCDYFDVNKSIFLLEKFYQQYLINHKPKYLPIHKEFSRRNQTERLSVLLNKIIE